MLARAPPALVLTDLNKQPVRLQDDLHGLRFRGFTRN